MEFKNPREIPIPEDWLELYQKLRPFSTHSWKQPSNNYFLIKKSLEDDPQITPQKLAGVSYLWQGDSIEIRDLYDQVFLAGAYEQFKTIIYAYHDYGGYYGFFRPDLLEVIKISQAVIRSADLVYVTTDSCDLQGNATNSFEKCFNNKLDMHLAQTLLYPIKVSQELLGKALD